MVLAQLRENDRHPGERAWLAKAPFHGGRNTVVSSDQIEEIVDRPFPKDRRRTLRSPQPGACRTRLARVAIGDVALPPTQQEGAEPVVRAHVADGLRLGKIGHACVSFFFGRGAGASSWRAGISPARLGAPGERGEQVAPRRDDLPRAGVHHRVEPRQGASVEQIERGMAQIGQPSTRDDPRVSGAGQGPRMAEERRLGHRVELLEQGFACLALGDDRGQGGAHHGAGLVGRGHEAAQALGRVLGQGHERLLRPEEVARLHVVHGPSGDEDAGRLVPSAFRPVVQAPGPPREIRLLSPGS